MTAISKGQRTKIQVYGEHEDETLECVRLLREQTTDYLFTMGPEWPTPTEVNRRGVSLLLKSLKAKGDKRK